jgi:hypothetical protein
MRSILAVVLLSATAHAQLAQLPEEPTIFVVTAPWCGPCQRFQRDWDTVPGFSAVVGTNYAVKRCSWDNPSNRAWAQRRGVTQIPTFIVTHRGRIIDQWSGYNGDWRTWLDRVGLADYLEGGRIVQRQPIPAPSTPPPATAEAPRVDLDPINDRLGNLENLIRNLSQSREIKPPEKPAEQSPFADPQPQPKPPATPRPPAKPTQEAKAGGLASSWGNVLGAVGKVALAVAAPEIALPAGALGVIGALARVVGTRRRSAVGQPPEPRQVVREVRETPVVVATQTPPPPQQVVTTNQFVPIDVDTHADAYTWASAELVKQYPGAQGTVAMLGSLIEQHKAAHGGFTNGNK